MKKKQLSIVLALLMLSTTLVACGGSKKDDVSADTKSETATEVSEVNTAENSSETSNAETPVVSDDAIDDGHSADTNESAAPVACDALEEDIVNDDVQPYTISAMVVTSTEFMENANLASNPNYIPAVDLGFESIPDDYEWFLQNSRYRYTGVNEAAQDVINNQDVIFAGLQKIAKDNGYGNIIDVEFDYDWLNITFDSTDDKVIVAYYSTRMGGDNCRIDFTVVNAEGTNRDIVLTTDVRPTGELSGLN